MAFSTYHTEVDVTADSNTETLPVDRLIIEAIPYSGSGATAVELWDGRMIQRIDGFRHRITLEWRELSEADHATLKNVVTNLYNDDGGTVAVDPNDNPSRTIDVVIEDAASALMAVFEGRVRKRPASISLISKDIEALPYSWLTS